MANSPDVKQYIDLTVFDSDPIAALNEILKAGKGLLPTWNPQAGQIETVLAEAFAQRTSQVIAAVNRLPSATAEVLFQLFGLTRNDGTKATATVTITFNDAVSHTLPSGTQFLYRNASSGTAYIYELTADFTATSSGSATVTAEAVGSAFNQTANGESLNLLSTAAYFQSAVFTTNASGGDNAETDTNYFTRAASLLASYTSGSTTSSQIKYYITGNKSSYANRVEVYNRRKYRDRDTTASSYGTHDGAILVAVGGTVNTAASASTELVVSSSNLSDLHTSLAARTPAGLTIDVMSAELASVDVTATVVKKEGATASTVKTAIETALKSYLDANVWDWSQQYIRRNEIISLIDAVTNVDYVSSLTMSGNTLIGTNNIGHMTTSGGSKATTTLTIAGGTPGTYTAGNAAFYYVDSTTDPDNPTVYTFVNTSDVTVSGGGASSGDAYQAISNGVSFNDDNNSGVIPAGTSGFVGSAGDTGGTATATAISGGTDDTSQFTALSGALVSNDLLVKNLGTLVTFGTLNITVS